MDRRTFIKTLGGLAGAGSFLRGAELVEKETSLFTNAAAFFIALIGKARRIATTQTTSGQGSQTSASATPIPGTVTLPVDVPGLDGWTEIARSKEIYIADNSCAANPAFFFDIMNTNPNMWRIESGNRVELFKALEMLVFNQGNATQFQVCAGVPANDVCASASAVVSAIRLAKQDPRMSGLDVVSPWHGERNPIPQYYHDAFAREDIAGIEWVGDDMRLIADVEIINGSEHDIRIVGNNRDGHYFSASVFAALGAGGGQ
jgi:hypothetical protein